MEAADTSLLDRLRQLDEQRPSVPGEHWLAFGLGLYLLLKSRRSIAGRLASSALGAAFIARALTGRDGAIAVLQRGESAPSAGDFHEVAATWPYRDRVRITGPRRLLRRAP